MEEKEKNQSQGAIEAEKIDAALKTLMDTGKSQNSEYDENLGRRKKQSGAWKKKKGRKKILIAAVLLAAIGFAVVQAAGSREKAPVVQTSLLTKGEIRETLSITGPIEGTDSVDVTSNLHAKIIELYVKEGDRVTAGETRLLCIDTADLEKQLEIAQGNYDLAAANKKEKVKELQRGYEKAVQDFGTAQDDFNRKSQLASTGDLAAVELETAKNALEDARRAVSAYAVERGQIVPDESLDIQISNAQIALEQARDNLDSAVITAPISGTVTRVNTKVGKFADGTESERTLLTIENLDELQMEIKVSEYNIGKVQPGQPVRITADILGDSGAVQGEIVSISPTGEERGNGSTERVIPTKVRILEKDSRLIAGITAKAEIVLDEKKNTYVVPIAAVGQDADGNPAMQFVLTDPKKPGTGVVHIYPVETGLESDLTIEIKADPLGADPYAGAEAERRYLPVYDPALLDGAQVQVIKPAERSAASGPAAAEETEDDADHREAEHEDASVSGSMAEETETSGTEQGSGADAMPSDADEIMYNSADTTCLAESEAV